MNRIEQAMPKRRPLESVLSERHVRLPRSLAIGSVFACALLLGGCNQDGSAADESHVVPTNGRTRVIERVAGKLKEAKTFEEARATIVEQFGTADRDIGSGVSIEQWDLDGGVLTLHLLSGPTFSLIGGDTVWLVETCNPLEENLLGSYEMTTKPDENNRGTRYWIGNLDLRKDGTYAFRDSQSNLDRRDEQNHNFFMNHPRGHYEIVYSPGLGPDTLLETLETRATLAKVTCAADGSVADRQYFILSDPHMRRLSFSAAGEIEFEMDKGWTNYWQ
jgi:hypothetical protein